jgi:hypothetical protein
VQRPGPPPPVRLTGPCRVPAQARAPWPAVQSLVPLFGRFLGLAKPFFIETGAGAFPEVRFMTGDPPAGGLPALHRYVIEPLGPDRCRFSSGETRIVQAPGNPRHRNYVAMTGRVGNRLRIGSAE